MPHLIRFAYECLAVVNGECVAARVPPLSVPEQPERFTTLIEYTGVPARRCNGMPATGEMVIEYLLSSRTQKWSVIARAKTPGDPVAVRPLEMLTTAATLRSGERRLFDSRPVRAIVSTLRPWKSADITGDPAPNPADFTPVESLWIDTDTLLPVRWEITQRQAVVGEAEFVYEQLDLQPPAGLKTPKCIP